MSEPDSGLRVLMLASEMHPYYGDGGVAETVAALAPALRNLGLDVRVALPRHGRVDRSALEPDPCMAPFDVPLGHHYGRVTVYRATAPGGVPVYFLDNPRYSGILQSQPTREDGEGLVCYGRGALEMLRRPDMDWRPDVIHCHDWQTALVPNYLATLYRDDPFYAGIASVFTIHQLADQGIFGYRFLELAGLEQQGFICHPDMADLDEVVDLLGRGIHFSDLLTAVSACYAQQIQTAAYGEHLDPLLRERSRSLIGVLNGLDMRAFDPSNDAALSARYDVEHLERRRPNKDALQQLLGLAQNPDTVLFAMFLHLQATHGLEFVMQAIELAAEHVDAQFAILGNGEQRTTSLFAGLASRHPGRVAVTRGYAPSLARRFYAGSDMFVMPSCLQPAELRHVGAMRYGSVPIVRAVGSFADTVHPYDPRTGTGTGFLFTDCDSVALYTVMVRALEVYRHSELWAAIQRRCMAADYSWSATALRYVDVYRLALEAHARGHSGTLRASGERQGV